VTDKDSTPCHVFLTYIQLEIKLLQQSTSDQFSETHFIVIFPLKSYHFSI